MLQGVAALKLHNLYEKPLHKYICEKLQKSPQKKQAVIKTLAEKSGIIHSQKQPSNNATSNETVPFIKNFFTCPDIVYPMAGIKNEITIHQNSTKKLERKYYLTKILQGSLQKLYWITTPVSDKVKCRSM